jgi:NAD(P)-dependent dehydrogenase (short-subunit alcohol dehydrogenase family)
MPDRFAGKTVVITGAASGQGRVAAELFARQGASLALCDIDADGLNETVERVAKESEVDIVAETCDVGDPADVGRFARVVLARFDAVHVLYNNAGVMLRASIEETTEAMWDRIMDINVKGPFFMVKEFLPGLIRAGGASVINVSSISGLLPPREGNTAYAASKGAVIALTRAQARDLVRYDIRVNCLVPGPIDTPMPAGAFDQLPAEQRPAARAAAVERNIIQRFGTAEEVVNVALFLAGPEASYMTGAMIPVDGGWTAC